MTKIQWEQYEEADEVRRKIQSLLPDPASVEDVKTFAARQQFEFSEITEGVIYCSIQAKSNLALASARWLAKFHFAAGRLSKITVDKGFTGF